MLTDLSKRKKTIIMISVMAGLFLAALDQTIVATAMPKIVEELNGLEHLSWVFTAYMLASTITVPIFGKLSDMYGRKPFLIGAIVIFLIGSILSGLSQNMNQLILFRAIQGVGGGALMATAFTIIADLFVPSERGRWQGLFGAVFGLSSVIGPLLGGWLTDNASWRWNFYINVPIGLVVLVLVIMYMPKIAGRASSHKIDYAGAATLAAGLGSLLLAVTWGGVEYAWNSWQILSLFAVSLASLVSFGLIERVAAEPILPLRLFKNRTFVVSMAVIFLTAMGMFGAILYIPLFAQYVIGTSATNSGTILTPMMLGLVASAIVSGQIIARSGKYKILTVAGLVLVSAAMYWMSLLNADTTQGELIVRMIALGLGLGVTMPVFNLAVQNALPQREVGVATASVQLFRNIGGTVGTAVMATVLNNTLADKLTNIGNDTFVKMSSQSGFNLGTLDGAKVEGLLSPQGLTKLHEAVTKLPPAYAAAVNQALEKFITTIQTAFAQSIAHVFWVGTILMVAALVITLFLPEVKLRDTNEDSLEEIGKELAVEEGTGPASAEPVLGKR